jgi:tetratricopeptide (TPR) repeat protein
MSDLAGDIETLLAQARRWLAAGEEDAAQLLAQRVLARFPSHPEAMDLLTALRRRHTPVAPDLPTPQSLAAAAHNNRGVAEAAQGRPLAALACHERALAIDPDHVEAWTNRGNMLQLLGQRDAALASYARAIAISPDYPGAFANRGHALMAEGRFEQALADFDRALELAPQLTIVMISRGNVLMALQRPDAALASFETALGLDPTLVEAAHGRAAALSELDRAVEAMAASAVTLALQPDHVPAIVTVGVCLHRLERFAAALPVHARALALKPDEPVAHYNRATSLMELRDFAPAIEGFADAIALRPDYAAAHWNEALCRLSVGDFAEGWRKYEWGWAAGQRGGQRDYGDRPRQGVQPWLGETPLAGMTLLLHAEQGIGDSLQFCRYAALARAGGARVILEVHAPLVRLLRRDPALTVIGWGEELPPFDRRTPLLSLPLAFGTTLATIPAEIPYLRHDTARTEAWRARLAAVPGLKVGLVWAGNPRPEQPSAHAVDRRRSLRLAQMAALGAVSGVTFVSLQKDAAASQAAWPPAGMTLLDWTGELADFADTADLVAALDLVITVDTSVAHLAGGLGRPVWVLSRHDACWRWLDGRTDSPWYPSLRLFRQPCRGDWDSVMAEVAACLAALASP